MVLTTRPGSMRWLRAVRLWALALLGLVVGHEAVFRARYGASSDVALAGSGHGYWLTFALLAVVLGGIPIAAATLGLLRLRMLIRRTRDGRGAGDSGRRQGHVGPSYAGELIGLLPRLALVVVVGFTLQENAESLLSGHGLPGLWVLDDAVVLPVLLLVSALVAVAGAWLRWREAVLVGRLAAARAVVRRVPRHAASNAAPHWGAVAAIVAHGWLIARRLAGRAPPVLAAA